MKKNARLQDFQVFCGAAFADEQRSLNESLFATYEPVRLWVKERTLSAPFRKLLVSLRDQETSRQWHGQVAMAAGVCEITESVSLAELREHAGNHKWVLGIVDHALRCVAETSSWRSDELEQALSEMRAKNRPLVHFFRDLALKDPSSGITCQPWLEFQPGITRLGVNLTDGTQRDVTVITKSGPMFLEDDFPIDRAAIRSGSYLLLDKAGHSLASVPL
jgi:hypothetical protein